MKPEEIISGLEYLLKESKIAKAKIDYSNETFRLKKRVSLLEERVSMLEQIINEKL